MFQFGGKKNLHSNENKGHHVLVWFSCSVAASKTIMPWSPNWRCHLHHQLFEGEKALWLTAEVSKSRAPDFLGGDFSLKVQESVHYEDMEGSWDKAGFAGFSHESYHWVITHPVLHYTMFIPFCHWWVWWYKVVSFSSSVLARLEEGTGRAVCV